MAELIDFDATLADAEGAPATFPFRFLGEEWELPTSPLAKDMLKVRRMYMRVAELSVKKATGQISDADADKIIELAGGADIEDLLGMLIGSELVEEWMGAGMTDAQLKAVFRYLWRLYNGLDPEAADVEGEALPPANRGQRRKATKSTASSSGSDSSRPTGSASTTKKSRKR